MILVEAYIREPINFLRSVTLKNSYFADMALNTTVNSAYRNILPDRLNPYYRHVLGEYILEDDLSVFESYAVNELSENLVISFTYENIAKPLIGKITKLRDSELRDGKLIVYTVTFDTLYYITYNDGITMRVEKITDPNFRYVYMSTALRIPGTKMYRYWKMLPNRLLYNKYDTMMYVKSFTNPDKTIEFTKENVKNDKRLASNYKMPNSYFFKLIKEYPTQSDLVKAIVYPIGVKKIELTSDKIDWIICDEDGSNEHILTKSDYETLSQYATHIYIPAWEWVIESSNFTMLNYDESLLEEAEVASIIGALNKTLEVVRWRWNVKEFVFEDLYPVAYQALLWDILYLVIYGQRIKNIKTASVHSFHVWEYLKSRGLGDYRYILNDKQTLFLYKNIDYILNNKGSQQAMEILIGCLLTQLNASLYTKYITQTYKNKGSNETGTVNTDPSPVDKDTTKYIRNYNAYIDADDQLNGNINNSCKPDIQVLSYKTGNSVRIKQAELFTSISSKEAQAYKSKGNITTILSDIDLTLDNSDNTTRVSKGTYEDLDSLYSKEKLSKLEYQDDNQFKLSTTEQTTIFKGADNSVICTKVHELNQNKCSLFYEQLYAYFVSDSLIYHMVQSVEEGGIKLPEETVKIKAVSSDFSDIDLTIPVAIILLMYTTCREVGLSLTYVPTKSPVKLGYKQIFEDIPETFIHKGSTYLIKTFLNDYDNFGIESLTKYGSVEIWANHIHSQAENFIKIVKEMLYSDSACVNALFLKLFNDRSTKGNYVFKLDKLLDVTIASGHNYTYAELFDSYPVLKNIIDTFNAANNTKELFGKLSINIIKAIYPIESTYLNYSEFNSSKIFEKIKELFINLCSYNVSFINNAINVSYFSTTMPRFNMLWAKNIHNYKWHEHYMFDQFLCHITSELIVDYGLVDIESTGPTITTSKFNINNLAINEYHDSVYKTPCFDPYCTEQMRVINLEEDDDPTNIIGNRIISDTFEDDMIEKYSELGAEIRFYDEKTIIIGLDPNYEYTLQYSKDINKKLNPVLDDVDGSLSNGKLIDPKTIDIESEEDPPNPAIKTYRYCIIDAEHDLLPEDQVHFTNKSSYVTDDYKYYIYQLYKQF